jgi:hypothetical protein
LLGHSKDIKTNSDIGAASALKLRFKYWMILHSSWTLILQAGFIVLIDNIDTEMQLNTTYRLESLLAITLS